MISESAARLKAAQYDELLKQYGTVVRQRDELLVEVAALRESVRTSQPNSESEDGTPLSGRRRPVSAGRSGSFRG
jgi:hypothetical protein